MLTLVEADRACMPFRRAMMSDPATMAYNAPWFPPDGCIPFPEEEWDAYLARWKNREPERFLGYLRREDGALVGEVCWHEWGREIGVVIKAEYRGCGYGTQGLHLLRAKAFSHPEIPYLENCFESDRDPAMAMHVRLGFKPVREEDGFVILRLER